MPIQVGIDPTELPPVGTPCACSCFCCANHHREKDEATE